VSIGVADGVGDGVGVSVGVRVGDGVVVWVGVCGGGKYLGSLRVGVGVLGIDVMVVGVVVGVRGL
jgi:hypothetical protein